MSRNNIEIRFLSGKEMANAKDIDYRYEHVTADNCGFADVKKNRIFVRAGLDKELSKYLVDHEIEHLYEMTGTHEDAHGIRHKGGFMRIFLPIALAIVGSFVGAPMLGALGSMIGSGLGGIAGAGAGAAGGLTGAGIGSAVGGTLGTTAGAGLGAFGGNAAGQSMTGKPDWGASAASGASGLFGGTGSVVKSGVGQGVSSGVGSMFGGGSQPLFTGSNQGQNLNNQDIGMPNVIPTMSNFQSGEQSPSDQGQSGNSTLGLYSPGLGQAGITLGGKSMQDMEGMDQFNPELNSQMPLSGMSGMFI